jgi:hypothetical protein
MSILENKSVRVGSSIFKGEIATQTNHLVTFEFAFVFLEQSHTKATSQIGIQGISGFY